VLVLPFHLKMQAVARAHELEPRHTSNNISNHIVAL
jgi:hypothetical protein